MEIHNGLGNQLFQVAAAYAFARRVGKRLLIGKAPSCGLRPAYWDSWLYKMRDGVASGVLPESRMQRRFVKYVEHCFHYERIPSNAMWLKGYFQTGKHFEECRETVKQLFDLPEEMKGMIRIKHAALIGGIDASRDILVHIRRSDFLNHLGLHGILGPEYYERAIEKARQLVGVDARLFVMSDDLAWCSQQQFLTGATLVDEEYDVYALWVMSQFSNYVMSNSSFSWWAVFLGAPSRIVVAPSIWFGPRGPQDFEDVYETSWVKCPV